MTHACLMHVPCDLEQLLCVPGHPERVPRVLGTQKVPAGDLLKESLFCSQLPSHLQLSVHLSGDACQCRTCVLPDTLARLKRSSFILIPFCSFETSSTGHVIAQSAHRHARRRNWAPVELEESEETPRIHSGTTSSFGHCAGLMQDGTTEERDEGTSLYFATTYNSK